MVTFSLFVFHFCFTTNSGVTLQAEATFSEN